MTDEDGPLLSREERIEVFSEEFVEHQEWAQTERERVQEAQEDILETIRQRPDTRIAKHGSSLSNAGDHRLTFTVNVAGNAWAGYVDPMVGEIEQTVATLRGEAEELRERTDGESDIAEQLEHRADRLEAAYRGESDG
ncbi:hypothetical protein ACFQO4_20755 [Saliphagus sp. GCM10025334]